MRHLVTKLNIHGQVLVRRGMKTLVLFLELDFSKYTKFILVQSLINGIKYLWPKAEAIEKEPRMKKNLNFYWN
jgi:hypothetical protein